MTLFVVAGSLVGEMSLATTLLFFALQKPSFFLSTSLAISCVYISVHSFCCLQIVLECFYVYLLAFLVILLKFDDILMFVLVFHLMMKLHSNPLHTKLGVTIMRAYRMYFCW